MSFVRRLAVTWQRDIPGARWFKADLHVHTIDDHPGGRAELPAALSGDPADPDVLSRYARLFLRSSVAAGVQVIGLTPHSPRAGNTPETSAVWKVVDEWNQGDDDDGIPFREKIYAVFPGFEPNVDDGASGVHLLFLFDSEIGRDRYLSLYDAIMDGRTPWEYSALRPAPRDADDIFATLDRSQSESGQSATPWRYIALAPHFQGTHGIFREMRSGVLERFPCSRLSGYELGDDKLPSDFRKGRKPANFLLPFMEEHRQAFFHASDAYSIDELGRRHTWVKLASPHVEALRQAFIASDSRMRIGFERSDDGGLQPIAGSPDIALSTRPWLKNVDIRGTASFFGAEENTGTSLRLSPDMTCIIGGSMTGKSTFLDGLRVRAGAPLPNDDSLRTQVETRGREIFGAGSPEVALDCPGSDPTAPPHEQWPAQFFAQNELQRLSQEASAVENILAKLDSSETREAEKNHDALRVDVERALAERGLDAARLREIQGLNRQASLLPSYEANLNRTRESLATSEASFARMQEERRALVAEQRGAFDRVMAAVEREFAGRIRARRIDDGDYRPLETFLRSLKQKGITRWWNDLGENEKSLTEVFKRESDSPEWWEDLDTLLDNPLDETGMSTTVQATFRESLTRAKRRELAALRCPDRYFLELRMDDGSYRRLDESREVNESVCCCRSCWRPRTPAPWSSTNPRTSSTIDSCSRPFCRP